MWLYQVKFEFSFETGSSPLPHPHLSLFPLFINAGLEPQALEYPTHTLPHWAKSPAFTWYRMVKLINSRNKIEFIPLNIELEYTFLMCHFNSFNF